MPTTVKTTCDWCGKTFEKLPCEMYPNNFCCVAHFRLWNSKRMSRYNKEENEMNKSSAWTTDRKEKWRDERLGDDIHSYRKYHGRHEHRVLAERLIGRPLNPDEVVHHIDGDKTNNAPENLRVMTRKEHSALHMAQQLAKKRGDRNASI